MERATYLAHLYESISSIPPDIQQCLLTIAQYGCHPDQVKRWYNIVRQHFGAAEPESTADTRATQLQFPPPAPPNPPVPPTTPKSRPTSSSGFATTASFVRTSDAGSHQQVQLPIPGEIQRTPTQAILPWMSPNSKSSRTDSVLQDTSFTTLPAPTDPQQPTFNFGGFDPAMQDGMLAFTGSGLMPPPVDPNLLPGNLNLQPMKYAFEMSSTQMPLLIPLEAASDPLPLPTAYLQPPETIAPENLMRPPVIPSTSSSEPPAPKRRRLQKAEPPERPRRPSVPFRTSELPLSSVESAATSGPGRSLMGGNSSERRPLQALEQFVQAFDGFETASVSMESPYESNQQLPIAQMSSSCELPSTAQGRHRS